MKSIVRLASGLQKYWLVSYRTLAITPAPPRQTRAQCTVRSAHCCCERLPPSSLQSDSGTCHHRTYTLLPATPHMSATGAMRCASVLLLLAAARALTPLPPGINAYEVAAGTRNRPAEALAPVALRAIAAAREANVKLGEIEFPALLGEKTAFDDVDNVQICVVEINKCVGCHRAGVDGVEDDADSTNAP